MFRVNNFAMRCNTVQQTPRRDSDANEAMQMPSGASEHSCGASGMNKANKRLSQLNQHNYRTARPTRGQQGCLTESKHASRNEWAPCFPTSREEWAPNSSGMFCRPAVLQGPPCARSSQAQPNGKTFGIAGAARSRSWAPRSSQQRRPRS